MGYVRENKASLRFHMRVLGPLPRRGAKGDKIQSRGCVDSSCSRACSLFLRDNIEDCQPLCLVWSGSLMEGIVWDQVRDQDDGPEKLGNMCGLSVGPWMLR